MSRDYYAVLGVAATAEPREIRRAYRRLARQYSPDVNFWDQSVRAIFQEIEAAYRVLGDPVARAMYDRMGRRGAIPDPGRRGDDVHVAIEVSFAEAARGSTAEVPVLRYDPCPDCAATGSQGGQTCGACGGRGLRRSRDVVNVEIPAGIDTGMQIRVAEEGSASPFGGPRGDLIVSTRVREHPFFHRRGHNVHCEVAISVWEALRGARIVIPVPTGDGVLVIPPGTASGEVFRLRGQGLPRLSAEGRGDVYVTVRVEIPTGLDARTDELVRELERLIPMDPRVSLLRFRGGAA